MLKQLLKNWFAPLAIGALSATLLISCYAMFWYVIPVGGNPHWKIVPVNFIKVFPVTLMFTSALFLIAGPVFSVLLRKLKLFTWWGTAVTGGLIAFALTSISTSSFSILVHAVYFLFGAVGALVSFLWHTNFNRLFERKAKDSGGASR